jgi:predicted RNA-binding protein YlqC (UPF0109 family)
MEALVKFLFEKMGFSVAEGALSSSMNDKGHALKLALSQADASRLAASDGRLLRSTRAILSAAATAQDTYVDLEITQA